MGWRVPAVLAVAGLVCSCGGDIAGPNGAMPAHGVLVASTVPGTCLVGGCDPANGEATTLGLVRIVNTGAAQAFVEACSSLPAVNEQVLVNGQWQAAGPPAECPVGPRSIAIAAGDSIRFNRFLAPGTRRLVLGVGTDANLASEALSISASFRVQ